MRFKPGCYLARFRPSEAASLGEDAYCLGTLRVVREPGSRRLRASGDLYGFAADAKLEPFGTRLDGRGVRLSEGAPIPIFPIENYRFYLEVKSILATDGAAELEVQAHRFCPATQGMATGGAFRILLTPSRKDGNLLCGPLLSGTQRRGEFEFRWISQSLRRADLRIIRIQSGDQTIARPGAALPGMVPGWDQVFEGVGWELNLVEREYSAGEVKGPPGVWTGYDLGMVWETLKGRLAKEPASPAHDWVYSVLCVSRFQRSQFLGVMFDTEATDLNDKPRESAAVAALQRVGPDAQGPLCQEAFQGKLYYRTALHEVGHAMNLTHTHLGNSLMNTTDALLSFEEGAGAEAELRFHPAWRFAPEDEEWLQHGPDIAVRPGGISRRRVLWQCPRLREVGVITLENQTDMTLEIVPVRSHFPYGAPIRLDYTLINNGPASPLPADLSLGGGLVSGRVTGPDRRTRYFRSAFRCCDLRAPEGLLKPKGNPPVSEGSATLLRGIDGALFPEPGPYRLELEVRWDFGGRTRRVTGETGVTVEDYPKDPKERSLRERVLQEREMMPALVQGLSTGKTRALLSAALSSQELMPHYVAIAMKCFAYSGEVARLKQGKARKGATSRRNPSGEPERWIPIATKWEQHDLKSLPPCSLSDLKKWLGGQATSRKSS